MQIRLILCAGALLLAACSQYDKRHVMHISVADQRLLLTDRGEPVASYPISTSKFGLNSREGSYGTPVGLHRVAKKIGGGLPVGAVMTSRRFTGEVLPVNAPGRDPIVTRILWLHGLEPHNRNSFVRNIYIHGTPEERNIGLPVSYGCVRMKSRDVIELYNRVGAGARVDIFREPLAARLPKLFPAQATPPSVVTQTAPPSVPTTTLAGDPPDAPRGL